jgi:thiamine-monophosphate kinase
MKVSELGEFGLIDLLAKTVSSSQNERSAPLKQLIVGIGDDAAAWQSNAPTHLATVDSLIQDVHFSLSTISWEELGWKSLAVNLSDIAAMGGVPEYALVSLALPDDTEVEDVAALYAGMAELARQFEVAIVGGDTCRAAVVSISITVLGSSRHKRLLRRVTARPGDKVAVTGYLGSAAAGLEMLTNRLEFNPEVTTYLRCAFLRPLPRIAEGQMLVKQGVATAIDISDGVLSDLNQICRASGVSARINVDHLPIHPMLRDNFGTRALELALAGGEDYELLFTASDEVINRVRQKVRLPVTTIGEITADRPCQSRLFDTRGNPVNISQTGWDHFKKG